MKQIAVLFLAGTFALSAPAQTTEPAPEGDVGEGVDLLDRGARLLFRGLLDEVEPAMRDLARELQNLNWQGLNIEDLDDYHPPEVLPNGDIILRRKTPEPDLPLPDGSEIEL
ncbi:AAA+ family ATPase [Oceaniglobus trochenteri]|uniref:AAA+ family ATPase n=1 Tax=Oceaniglobus trochenteri TaxID=2763260 RepID=UPI001D000D4B|nr:AAA+ family ATPase [Oceaniglobus trochenteri]